MPEDFCAYAYLPYRARIPENAQNIDQANTSILQNEYIPNSGKGVLDTVGVKPTGPNTGNSAYPVNWLQVLPIGLTYCSV